MLRRMTEFVTSADGTRIAYDRLGSGAHAIILVGSAMNYRAFDPTTAHIATLLAAEIPDAELVELDWAGHLPAVERPDEVTALLLDWLGRSAVSTVD